MHKEPEIIRERTTELKFCTVYKYQPYPCTNWQLVQFAQHLFNENKKPETIQNYVSSVRTLHKLAGYPEIQKNDIYYHMIVDGHKHLCVTPVKQAELMDHDTLLLLFSQVNVQLELHAVAWTAILVGFSLVFRVSNLGLSSRKNFSQTII